MTRFIRILTVVVLLLLHIDSISGGSVNSIGESRSDSESDKYDLPSDNDKYDHPSDKTRRKLSHEDKVMRKGRWNVTVADGWTNGQYLFVHIPKSGGSSFLTASSQYIPIGSRLHGNREFSVNKTPGPRINMVIVLRQPREHVLSQYLECKYDWWGKTATKGTNFPGNNDKNQVYDGLEKWLDHFLDEKMGAKMDAYKYAYKCYNPWNMQARYISTDNDHVVHDMKILRPSINTTISSLKSVGFVGITEYSDETICLFQHFMAGKVSPACTCDPEAHKLYVHNKQIYKTHGVPKHSVQDLSPEVLKKIDALTEVDNQIYEFALKKFLAYKEFVERKLNTSFTCS